MVLLKRMLDNGFNGYHSSTIPRAPRSIRRKGFCQKASKGNGICAFDLLATVAGKLLEESECSSASSSAVVGFDQHGIGKDVVKKEPLDVVEKHLGGEHDEQGSSEGSVFYLGLYCKRKVETGNDHASAFVSSSCSVKVDSESVKVGGNVGRNSPKCGDSYDIDVEKVMNKKLGVNGGKSGDINECIARSNSGEDTELRLCQNSNTNGSFLKLGNDVKVGCKDDDEILSNYSQPNSTIKACKSTHNRDRKVNKLLTSKYWNTAPKLKDCENANRGGALKPMNYSKRSCYDLNMSQRNTPFKKRKLFDRSSVVTYGGGISCESVSNSPEKSNENDKNASGGKLQANGTFTSAFGRQKSDLRDSQVCLSIKSFEVPELFIEVPESTTIGSLKKTVLETVTSILGGGLRVGVLVHGKKIRDDKTLLQTGISKTDDMGSVGFILEPESPNQPLKPICSENLPMSLPCDSPKTVNRSQINLNEDALLSDTPEKLYLTNSNSPAGSSGELASPAIELTVKTGSESKALVPVPEVNMEALAVVPVNQRPNKRSDIGQRRTRRPFSVTEVEALVHAVEKLGTGRWRDVKLCAFENAEHRTYVDLKDKWKTLVHTARISPQQRRGEPVPQDLLDRVLAAQAHWSEHQAKQHGKQQQNAIIPKLTDS